jgi:hypothetical protein
VTVGVIIVIVALLFGGRTAVGQKAGEAA